MSAPVGEKSTNLFVSEDRKNSPTSEKEIDIDKAGTACARAFASVLLVIQLLAPAGSFAQSPLPRDSGLLGPVTLMSVEPARF